MISDIWRCDGREILPLMLDDSASRWCHESRSARYSERLFAQKDAGGRPDETLALCRRAVVVNLPQNRGDMRYEE